MRLTDSMRLECAPLGIKVMLVSPGFISTNARSNAKVCIQRLITQTYPPAPLPRGGFR